MALFMDQIVTPPAELPVIATDAALVAAVVNEIELTVLWRAIVHQTRRILIDGDLPARIEIEPVTAITSLTKYTPDNDAAVIDPADYMVVTRSSGTIIAPHDRNGWPAAERSIGSFALTYECGWTVTAETSPGANDAVNEVPAAILFMIDRATKFRAGSSGVGDIEIGSLKLSVADSYSTDALPREITNIARAWAYRPGIIAARP